VDKEILLVTKKEGISNISNPLFKYLNHLDPNEFFGSLFPSDDLHTHLKGLVEYAFRWTVSLIFVVGKIDKLYRSSIGKLDVVYIKMNILST
jgi:hypothetical protein